MPSLFATVGKFLGQFLAKEDNGLTDSHTILSATEAEHVHAHLPCDLLRLHAQRGHGIGKPRTIHVQSEVVPIARLRNPCQISNRINSRQLCGLRDADDARLGIVNITAPLHRVRNALGRELAVWTGKQQ